MILHLALMLALNAASAPAADKPLVLRTVHTFANGVPDRNFMVLASPARDSVNLWSLETGRQTGQVEIPTMQDKHRDDFSEIRVHAVRPDIQKVLVSYRHYFYRAGWTSTDGGDAMMERGVQTFYLASMEDEKDVKRLWTFDGPCAYIGGIQSYRCPDVYADIASDRPEVSFTGTIYEGRVTKYEDQTSVNMVLDFNGKKLFENNYRMKDYETSRKKQHTRPGPALAPHRYVRITDQSCSVMLGDKRVAFLEGCVQADSPDMSADGKTAFGAGQPVYKKWDAANGTLIIRLDPQIPEGWSNKGWATSADGRIAAVLLGKNSERQVQIWNVGSGKRLATGGGPALEDVESFTLLPDGRRALYMVARHMEGETIWHGDRSLVLADLGLDEVPEAAPAAPAAAKLDVDTLPSGSSAPNPDAFAVVIGVEKYRQAGVPAVDYASRDAKTMAAYLGGMGFDAKNVAVLTDAQAGKVDFDKHFGKWLKNRVGPKSRVFVYYAGHGAPNPTTGAGYLMPYEADPAYLEETAYPVTLLYAELGKLPTKDVTVVLDACFSGQGERSLIAKGTRPLVPVQAARGPENAAVIAAASGSQISASDHEARHGLLTYHLLAGLHGEADSNKDGSITTSELFAYARPAVERAAKLQNVEQTPTVSGDTGAAGARVWTTLKKP